MLEFTNKRGKRMGVLHNREYVSIRKPNHFFRKFRGFGISKVVLLELESLGCEDIKIIYEGKKETIIYRSKLKEWLKSDLTYKYDGKDTQIFLSIDDINVESDKNEPFIGSNKQGKRINLDKWRNEQKKQKRLGEWLKK